MKWRVSFAPRRYSPAAARVCGMEVGMLVLLCAPGLDGTVCIRVVLLLICMMVRKGYGIYSTNCIHSKSISKYCNNCITGSISIICSNRINSTKIIISTIITVLIDLLV